MKGFKSKTDVVFNCLLRIYISIEAILEPKNCQHLRYIPNQRENIDF